MYYVGLDLHKKYVTLCAMDSEGTVCAAARRLEPELDVLLAWLTPLPQPTTVVIESTLYWAWLYDRLTAAGYAVLVAHPQQVKLISHARCKTDPIDARKLADLARTNLLPTIWVPDVATRARRTFLRGRAGLVRMRTRLKIRIHAYLTAENERVPTTDLFGKAGRVWLQAVALPPTVRTQVDCLLRLLEHLDAELKVLDREVRRLAAAEPIAQQLASIPGIGAFGALLLAAEIGTVERFTSSHEFAAYAGLVPSTKSSGGKTAHGGVGPAGSGWLKWILVEAVQHLKREPGPVYAHYVRLLAAKGRAKATVAAARKLACYIYWMLKEGRSYEDWLRQRVRREVRPEITLASVG
jgi:transposase